MILKVHTLESNIFCGNKFRRFRLQNWHSFILMFYSPSVFLLGDVIHLSILFAVSNTPNATDSSRAKGTYFFPPLSGHSTATQRMISVASTKPAFEPTFFAQICANKMQTDNWVCVPGMYFENRIKMPDSRTFTEVHWLKFLLLKCIVKSLHKCDK